ncbi:unnamed protein product [Trichobilharzia regenti]|nr:unnamed protein product [Trichobilharzia regenti]
MNCFTTKRNNPDKGSGIVILNRDDYVYKLRTILSDEEKFQKSPDHKDKTEKTEKELSKTLTKLKQECIITPYMYEQLKPSVSTIPRLYGLPKVPKDDVPLRPVLDMLNSPFIERNIKKESAPRQITVPMKKTVYESGIKKLTPFLN